MRRTFLPLGVAVGLVLALLWGVQPASAATVGGLRTSSVDATGFTLHWNKQSGAAKYRVYVSPTSSMPSRCEPNCEVVTPSDLGSPSHRVTGLKPGTSYWIKVSAINSSGKTMTSWQSKPLKVTLSKTVGGLAAQALSSTSMRLTWDAYPDATRYRVYVSPSSTMPGTCEPHCEVITPANRSKPSFDKTGLKAGGTYWVKVSAINSSGKTISGWQSGAVKIDLPDEATKGTVDGIIGQSLTSTSLRLRWNPYPGAAKYRLYVSPSSSMPSRCEPHCQVITPRDLSAPTSDVTDLKGGATYWIKISAINSSGKTISSWQSTAVKVALPEPSNTVTGILGQALSPTSLRASWDAYPGAVQYRVYTSPSSSMPGRCEPHCKVITPGDAAAPSATIQGLKAGAPHWIKVSAINKSGKTISSWQSTGVRVDLPDGGEVLTVASFNVKCQSCYSKDDVRLPTELPWLDRRDEVAATIVSRSPDVIGIQEASQAWLIGADGKQINRSQFEDLLMEVNKLDSSYALTNTHRNNCVKSTTPTNCSYKDQGASKGTKIIYDTDTMTLVKQGSKMLKKATATTNERYLAWAILEQKGTGERFFFANTHLEPGTSYYSIRQTQARELMAEVDRRNVDDLPVVLVGDFNSTRYAEPTNAPYDVFVGAGLVDPLGHTYKSPKVSSKATAERRINAHYNSYGNFSPIQRKYAPDENGSNLDYILTSPMRTLEWETVVNPGPDGNIVGVIPSDHNMLVAKLLPGS